MLSFSKAFFHTSFAAILFFFLSAPVIAAPEANQKTATSAQSDPRTGEVEYERSKRLLSAIDEILKDAATIRQDARKLPSKHEFSIIAPPWIETREDRQLKVDKLLDAALEIVTEVPIVDLQKKMRANRTNIKKMEDQIAVLREKQQIGRAHV